MAEADTTSSPADWKEGRRFRAFELAQQGWKQKHIAAALGVQPSAVSQWLKAARSGGGKEALRRRKASGAPRRLSQEQRDQLPALLEQGAEALGFRGQVWTAARVAEVIRRTFGVTYSHRHTRRLLHQIGWSVQKPEKKAVQRDEAAIQAWRNERWPALKRGHSASGAPSSS
jgi:transposase